MRWTQADLDRHLNRKQQVTVPVKKAERFFTGWNQQRCTVFIGIDSGVKTGVAVWNKTKQAFDLIATMTITRAQDIVKQYVAAGHVVTVRVEDPRQRKYYGKNSNSKLQGAGSVKRDAKVWEDYLKEQGINYEMVHPIKGGTKLTKEQFFNLTGYTGLTSEHARDAAMIVYKM